MTSPKYFQINGRRVVTFDTYNTLDKDIEVRETSAKWARLKAKALKYYGGCVICGTNEYPELHHRYYYVDGAIDDYELPDVSILCHRCHGRAHGKTP
jgi:hypothetical protein